MNLPVMPIHIIAHASQMYRVYNSQMLSSTISFIFSSHFFFCDSVFLPHPAYFSNKVVGFFFHLVNRRMDALSKMAYILAQNSEFVRINLKRKSHKKINEGTKKEEDEEEEE